MTAGYLTVDAVPSIPVHRKEEDKSEKRIVSENLRKPISNKATSGTTQTPQPPGVPNPPAEMTRETVPTVDKPPKHRLKPDTAPTVVKPPPTKHRQVPPTTDNTFLEWCRHVLGVETKLEIQTFEYYNFMQEYLETDDDLDDDEFCDFPGQQPDNAVKSVEDLPMMPIRGLAAAQDIKVGDVVISIPFNAMISVPTTIDHDPVLSRVLGPQARAVHGWDDAYFEIPLLTVALLYHLNLKDSSPLHHYLELLVESGDMVETMPFLWTKQKLRQEAKDGVRKIAKYIQRDLREMYQSVVVVLVEEHGHLFGKPDTGDWMYSFSMFQWGFAMVNSRHWHLPIPDLDVVGVDVEKSLARKEKANEVPEPALPMPTLNEQVPPAEQPTDEWVRGQEEAEQHEIPQADVVHSHSFLVPVADLINFGPPCTRGAYNAESQAFEIIATCPFRKGQEVTYWYSDDCDDVIIANYGFTHPMVPSCPSVEDWRQKSDAWKRQAEKMESELLSTYKEMDELDAELTQLHSLLEKCDCDDDSLERRRPRTEGPREQPNRLRHDGNEHEHGVRGRREGQDGRTDHERHRIRRSWSKKSDSL